MAKDTKAATGTATSATSKGQSDKFPLDKTNFIMIGVCVVLIVIGFALMGGSGNTGKTFNYDIFNNTRTVVGPMVALLGFVLMIFAIIFNKKSDKSEQHKDVQEDVEA